MKLCIFASMFCPEPEKVGKNCNAARQNGQNSKARKEAIVKRVYAANRKSDLAYAVSSRIRDIRTSHNVFCRERQIYS
jgi:hypothetical protein